MVWVGRDSKDHPVPTPQSWDRTSVPYLSAGGGEGELFNSLRTTEES